MALKAAVELIIISPDAGACKPATPRLICFLSTKTCVMFPFFNSKIISLDSTTVVLYAGADDGSLTNQ
uniref:Uncharacterized protein n=1 Tax=Virus NIOZ-UU157 TaxID=2763269 RepID=A0A7S9STV2_9VIRU|nr:MAG: hypothetical protein NIOZUU157_00130 [Virus NIOZ-UU157]